MTKQPGRVACSSVTDSISCNSDFYFPIQNRRYSKMEKADILEMAVQYLRHLQDASKGKYGLYSVLHSAE